MLIDEADKVPSPSVLHPWDLRVFRVLDHIKAIRELEMECVQTLDLGYIGPASLILEIHV